MFAGQQAHQKSSSGLSLHPCTLVVARCWGALLGVFFAIVTSLPIASAAERTTSAVGAALGTIFNPALAPDVKTMGLAQRVNFVDFVKEVKGTLQLAIVIDATESMEEQLDGVKSMVGQMMNDLRRTLGDRVAFQILTFRDVGYEGTVIEWPIAAGGHAFVKDMSTIQPHLDKLKPGSGSPYFYEPADLAVYTAIQELPWSDNPHDARWLIFIGDAPPYQQGFNEPETRAARLHSDAQLVSLANAKNILLHAIVCPTREVDQPVYDKVLNELISFCSTLTTQTGGMMLDLSNPEVLATIQQAAQNSVDLYVEIDPITQSEIDQYKSTLSQQNTNLKRPIRVAVLPHLSRDKMDFSRRNPAVLVADEMRAQLDSSGIDTVYMHQIEPIYFRYAKRSKDDVDLLRQLAAAVEADYILWGKMDAMSPTSIQTSVFESSTLQLTAVPLVRAKDASQAKLCSAVLQAVSQHTKSTNRPASFAAFLPNQYKTRLVSSSPEVERLMASARLALEQAVELEASNPLSSELYSAAEEDLNQAIRLDPQNPVIYSMLANVFFGRYQIARHNQSGDAESFLKSATRFGSEAYRNRNRAEADDARELEADFRFYQGRFADAATLYEKLVQSSASSDQARRAHWMLVGIYAGDWGVKDEASELVNLTKAREHTIAILANWSQSHEATIHKQQLAWSDQAAKTVSPHLPIARVPIPVATAASE